MVDDKVGINVQLDKNEKEFMDAHGGPTKFIREAIKMQGNRIRDFQFSDSASNRDIYYTLLQNPNAGPFFFKKYRENQKFIRELCDPENPLFNADVADVMKSIVTVQEIKDELGNLNNEKTRLISDIEGIQNDLKEGRIRFADEKQKAESELTAKQKEIETITTKLQILSGVESEKILRDVFPILKGIAKAIEDEAPMTMNSRWNSEKVAIKTADFKNLWDKMSRLNELLETELVPVDLINQRQKEVETLNQKLKLQIAYALDNDIEKLLKKVIADLNAVGIAINGKNSLNAESVQGLRERIEKNKKRLEKWVGNIPTTIDIGKNETNPEFLDRVEGLV
jgi:hypothetical protein